MADECLPGRHFPVEVARVHIRERPEPAVPLVGIPEIDRYRHRHVRAQLHAAGILEAVRQTKRTLMKEVVSHPGVGHRCLGWMALTARCGWVSALVAGKPGMGTPRNSALPLLAGKILGHHF